MILPDRSAFGSFTAWLEEMKRVLEAEDEFNYKRNQTTIFFPGAPAVLVAADGSRWKLVVDGTGVLTTEAA